MKKSRFTETQIAFALRQAEGGTAVREICRKMGISEQTFYRWKKKFAGTRDDLPLPLPAVLRRPERCETSRQLCGVRHTYCLPTRAGLPQLGLLCRDSIVLVDMAPAPLEQDRHAGVDNPVDDLEPVAPAAHHADLGQALELVRDGLSGHLDLQGQVADIEFPRADQGMEQPKPGRVREALEQHPEALGLPGSDELSGG